MTAKQKTKMEADRAIAKEALRNEQTLFFANDDTRVMAEYYFIMGMNHRKKKPVVDQKPKEEIVKPFFKPFIEVWDKKYHNFLTMPRDGAKVKSIILMTINFIIAEGKELHPRNVMTLWGWVVDNLHRTWWHNKSLSAVESHYLEIIRELRYGKQNPNGTYNAQPSGRRSAAN